MSSGADESNSSPASEASRIDRLERQVALLTMEVARLRGTALRTDAPASPPPPSAIARASHAAHVVLEGDEIESLIGRYGTLLFAALVLVMGVGVLVKVAIVRGMLTPEVRIGIGALVAAGVGGAGLWFHRRGEVRYGNVLLAIALALVDLVAWGAGPRFHLVPSGVALAVVDAVALALAALALRDESEFLFCIAVAGALLAPFVASEGGSSTALLAYGGGVLLGAMRAARHADWWRAFAVLVAGAVAYTFAAATMPLVSEWYGPFAIVLFGGVCAAGALLFAEREWRGRLARAFLLIASIGVPIGWDRIAQTPLVLAAAVALAIAAVTYLALWMREPREELWTASALVLPLVSLGVLAARVAWGSSLALTFAAWSALALAMWSAERLRAELHAGGAHLLAGALFGSAAIVDWLWSSPLELVAGLAIWGVVMAAATRAEVRPLPLVGPLVALGGAGLSALDQLASREAYVYTPFFTRSSASALCAAVGLGLAGLVMDEPESMKSRWAERPVRLAAVIGFVLLWGRMEMAGAFSPDLSAFLLIAYYGACGLGSILIGRRIGAQWLRLVGLALAIYAAVKAVVEASEIGGIPLRVGAYGAVGVFLLGAGYLYREVRVSAEGVATPTVG